MRLYRGIKGIPKFFTPIQEQELKSLQKRIASTPDGGALINMNRAQLVRYGDLVGRAKPQVFTDREEVGKDFAGEDGFVLVIEVPDSVARDHYDARGIGMGGMMSPGKKVHYGVDNFAFKGVELFKNHPSWEMKILNGKGDNLDYEIDDKGEVQWKKNAETNREGNPWRTFRGTPEDNAIARAEMDRAEQKFGIKFAKGPGGESKK